MKIIIIFLFLLTVFGTACEGEFTGTVNGTGYTAYVKQNDDIESQQRVQQPEQGQTTALDALPENWDNGFIRSPFDSQITSITTNTGRVMILDRRMIPVRDNGKVIVPQYWEKINGRWFLFTEQIVFNESDITITRYWE